VIDGRHREQFFSETLLCGWLSVGRNATNWGQACIARKEAQNYRAFRTRFAFYKAASDE
jgi:hypothetical protein